MSAPIDVLAVMDADARHAALHRKLIAENVAERAAESAEARAAVAELIAADREYDAAMARRVTATNAIVSGDRSDDAFRRQATTDHAFDRAVARRTAALARVGGAA